MSDTFNLKSNVKAERKLLVTAVNVGTSDAAIWEIVGAGVEDSKVEFNPDVKTTTDILGNTETVVNKFEPVQSFDPYTVRGGSKLAFKLYDIWKRKAVSELSNFEVLLMYGFVDGPTTGTFEAEKQTGCTISPKDMGGSSYVDFPIDIHYSNISTLGSVNAITGNSITFTPTVAA